MSGFPPVIEPGEATTLVPFPVSYFASTPAPSSSSATASGSTSGTTTTLDVIGGIRSLHARQHLVLVASVFCMFLLFLLPKLCTRNRFCASFLGKRMRLVFLGLASVNFVGFCYLMSTLPDVSVNSVFFLLVEILEAVLTNVENLLESIGALLGVFLLFQYRSNLVRLLGLEEHPLVNADCRDVLTCFSANRFRPIELQIAYATGLPDAQTMFQSKTQPLFCLLQAGKWNEARATRVKEVVIGEDFHVREKLQFNYDEEDITSFRLVLSVQRQEVVGQDAAQAFMPAAGAVAGGIFGGALYPVTGAVAGAGFGLSAANAFGEVVAKCELSAAMINHMLEADDEALGHLGGARGGSSSPSATGLHSTRFNSEEGSWHTLNLVPMGEVRVRFRRLDDAEDEDDGKEDENFFADMLNAVL